MKRRTRSEQGKLNIWQKKAAEGGVCPLCQNYYSSLTIDHIIPHFLLQQLGLYDLAYSDEDNFRIICKPCNTMKANRCDMMNPLTIPLLEKYLYIIKERYQSKHQ